MRYATYTICDFENNDYFDEYQRDYRGEYRNENRDTQSDLRAKIGKLSLKLKPKQ